MDTKWQHNIYRLCSSKRPHLTWFSGKYGCRKKLLSRSTFKPTSSPNSPFQELWKWRRKWRCMNMLAFPSGHEYSFGTNGNLTRKWQRQEDDVYADRPYRVRSPLSILTFMPYFHILHILFILQHCFPLRFRPPCKNSPSIEGLLDPYLAMGAFRNPSILFSFISLFSSFFLFVQSFYYFIDNWGRFFITAIFRNFIIDLKGVFPNCLLF